MRHYGKVAGERKVAKFVEENCTQEFYLVSNKNYCSLKLAIGNGVYSRYSQVNMVGCQYCYLQNLAKS
jgi:hypothetical protein